MEEIRARRQGLTTPNTPTLGPRQRARIFGPEEELTDEAFYRLKGLALALGTDIVRCRCGSVSCAGFVVPKQVLGQ